MNGRMTPQRWQQVKQIVDAALDLRSGQREAFLSEACGDDGSLRGQVDRLIRSHEEAGSFIESPAYEGAAELIVGNERRSYTGLQLGHYSIVSRIGAGGMGEVYLAHDIKLDRKVAIKFLSESLVGNATAKERLVREAKAAAKLDHPNICSIYEIGEEAGVSFIVMQYVEGETLASLIKRAPMDLGESVDVAVQVADALAEAHSHGVIHRDIKPANIMITARGQAKVLDFGLAKISLGMPSRGESDAPTALKTEPGLVMGTMQYMSPEQLLGRDVDPRTDIFSLGVVMYEMATARRPFSGKTASETMDQIIHSQPEAIARLNYSVPAELERIIRKCIEKDPSRRYQSARDLLVDLRNLKRDNDSAVVVGEVTSRRRSNIRRGVIAATIVASLVVALLGLYLMRGRNEAIETIAVLPFVNANVDPNAEYLADGIPESIMNSLSQLPNLKVMSRNSVFRFKGQATDAQEVGQKLGVRAVLTGRVSQRGEGLAISIELVDARDNSQIWGQQYNRKLADVFAAQEEIAKEISERLRLRLTGEQQNRLTKRYTDNADAWLLYIKGRYFWDKRSAEGMEKARQFFSQAIEVDPAYALAYSGLADTYLFPLGGLPRRETMPRARAYAKKALQIDDTLAEPHTSLAFEEMSYELDWKAAEREFSRAIQLSPNYPVAHQLYGPCLLSLGRTEEALRESKRALDLDPLSLAINWHRGLMLYFARRYDEAIDQLRKTIQMAPDYVLAHSTLGWAYLQKGMYTEAVAELERGGGFQGPARGGSISRLAFVDVALGKRAEAEKILNDLKQMPQDESRPVHIARVYTALGEKDSAIRSLERAYLDRAFEIASIKVDPEFDGLRSDERFKDLLRRIGLEP